MISSRRSCLDSRQDWRLISSLSSFSTPPSPLATPLLPHFFLRFLIITFLFLLITIIFLLLLTLSVIFVLLVLFVFMSFFFYLSIFLSSEYIFDFLSVVISGIDAVVTKYLIHIRTQVTFCYHSIYHLDSQAYNYLFCINFLLPML